MFGKPLLAHPAQRRSVHTAWHPHSGDDDRRDRHHDKADDEQHRVLAVTRPFLGAWRSLHFYSRLSVRLCTGLQYMNAVASGDRRQQYRPCVRHGRNAVASVCIREQRRSAPSRTLLACNSYCSRPYWARFGFGGVDRWPHGKPELTNELGCRSWRRRPAADRHDVAVESSPNYVRAHSGGTRMTDLAATVADPEAELRWRNWQARGAEGDRRTAKRMRGLMFLIAAVSIVWFVVQLA
jgi:hypothetical protein